MNEKVKQDRGEYSSRTTTWWNDFWQLSSGQKFWSFCKGGYAAIKVLATFAGLVAFVALYLSIQQYEDQQDEALIQTTQAKVNQFMALGLEIEANIVICDTLLGAKEKWLAGGTPYQLFVYATLGEALTSGAISDELLQGASPDDQFSERVDERGFNFALMGCYHGLQLANMIIGNAIRLDVLATTADREMKTLAVSKTKLWMTWLVNDVECIKGRLKLILPEVERIRDYHRSVLDSLVAKDAGDGWI